MTESKEELWHLLIVMKSEGRNFQLRFKSKEKCFNAVPDALAKVGDVVDVSDDYGHSIRFRAGEILALVRIDVSADLEYQIEFSLMQARSKAKLERRAQTDPLIPKQQQSISVPASQFRPFSQ